MERMGRTVRAEIHWNPAKLGSRQYRGQPYRTTALFLDEIAHGASQPSWTLIVTFRTFSLQMEAQIHFLVEEAPHELLYPTSRFQL